MKNLFSKFIALCLIGLALAAHGASVTFTADTTTELDTNTERGHYFSIQGAEWCNSVLTNVRDGAVYGQKSRLFLYEWLPGVSVAQVGIDLACARAAGVKVIFYQSYCDTPGCNEGAVTAQAETLLASAKTTLLTYRDVIYTCRAGTIGAYGEWADSVAGLDTLANKIRIRDAYMNMCPPEIPVVFRNPPAVQEWFPFPLTTATAFRGNTHSRSGLYNDCYMSQPDDHSTYPGVTTVVDFPYTQNAASQRAYAAAQTGFAPYGGETCNGGALRLSCTGGTDNAGLAGGIMNEGPRYHQSYLNRSYYDVFQTTWISEGCYSSVNNLMGYRLQYDSIVHADTMTRGATGSFYLTMRNYGWARIYSGRQVQVRLVKAGATDIVCKFTPFLRTLPPQATASTPIRTQCAIPAGAAVGSYSVYLEIPDVYSTLTAYKIQNANANSGGQTWDSTNRRYATGTTVTVN